MIVQPALCKGGPHVEYQDHWGLQAPPFENVPDPAYYFPSAKHEEARHRLLYAVHARKGVLLLTGEIGCGKTLLSRAIILNLPRSTYDIALVANPALPAMDFLTEVLYQLGIEATGTKVELLHRLNDSLLANRRQGLETVLVVDEAQSIEDDRIFEALRLLLNVQLNNRFLLTVVLMGQPELKARVEAIPQLAQRIAIRYHLAPFSADETWHYIRFRLKVSGSDREIFTKDAVSQIFQQSSGISRLINSLCDLCLLLGYQEKMDQIDLPIVERAGNMLRHVKAPIAHRTEKQSEPASMPGLTKPQATVSFPASGPNGAHAQSRPALQAGPDWYRMAEEELSHLAETVRHHAVIQLEALTRIATGIVQSLHSSDRLVVQAHSGTNGSPLITNLVNVSILSTKLEMGLEFQREELERLALAGLVHDIGIFAVPESLVLKPHRLTHSEREIIEQHPEVGFQVLSTLGSSYSWLAQVVRQAHERWKGQGYPNKLKGSQIHDYAQIIGIVDIFDALISPRPYRRRILPHEAVRELLMAEQSSFSRELIRALVEQLSVYPLGTTVRLNTGEVGVVTQLNSGYPLRPIVQVNQIANHSMPNGPKLADLSKTPLVYIVETLEPPTIANLASALQPPLPATSSPKGVASSEQFAALLENLDAIAGAVEQVVETPTDATSEPERAERIDEFQPKPVVIARSDDPFQKEVLKLFALEAQEWLRQIRGALRELEGTPDQRDKPKLFDMILRGVTNLGGSVVTVELHAIQQLAFGLLPLLQALRSQGTLASAEQCTALRDGLERVTAAVQQVVEPTPATSSGEPTRITAGIGEAVPSAVPTAPVAPMAPPFAEPVVTPPSPGPSGMILEALRELQQARARSLEPTRNEVEVIIQRAQGDPAHRSSPVDGPAVRRILQELDRLDEQFLVEVQRQVPMITMAVSALKSGTGSALVSNESLEPILREVHRLHEAATAVNATAIMLLLHGLHTFLTVVAHRRVSLVLQRLEAVESRLGAITPMAQQWVDVGRIERTAIGKILPQS